VPLSKPTQFPDDDDSPKPSSWCGPNRIAALKPVTPFHDPAQLSALGVDQHFCHDGDASVVAHSHEADGALLCASGPAGIAQMMIDWLPPDFDVLLSRDTSHTFIDALLSHQRDFAYVAVDYLPHLDAFGEVNLASLAQALQRSSGPVAVFVKPTGSHGRSQPIDAIADLVHGQHPRSVVIADGAHEMLFGLHAAFPPSALSQGADVVTLLPYEAAGALQGAAVAVWQGDRVDPYRLRVAHDRSGAAQQNDLVVESISASLRDFARRPDRIDHSIEVATLLRRRLMEELPRLDFPGAKLDGSSSPRTDPTRTLIGLGGYAVTGYELRRELRRHRVFVNGAGLNTLQLFTRFDQETRDVDTLVTRLGTLLDAQERGAGELRGLAYDPFATLQERPACSPVVAARIGEREGIPMPLADAIGQVACHRVGVPGDPVPVLVPGFRVTPSAIHRLESAASAGIGIEVAGGWTGEVVVAPRWLTSE
jgi:arginine decarboxylase